MLQALLLGEFGLLALQGVVLVAEFVVSGGDAGAAACELGEVDEVGLVGVEETGSFLLGVGEAFELVGDQVVVARWGAEGEFAFAGGELLRVEEDALDFIEDEGVALVAPDVAFWAAVVVAAGVDDAVVTAVVAVVAGAVSTAHLVAAAANVAVAALNEAAEEEAAGVRAAGVELEVLTVDALRTLEQVAVDDGGDGDGDPLFLGAIPVGGLEASAAAGGVGHVDRFAPVVVDGADLVLVADEAAHGRGGPGGSAGR